MPTGFLLSRVLLQFDSATADEREDLLGEISAIARTPDGSLWLGSDELRIVERLCETAPGIYSEHQRFHTRDFVELFDESSEIDIEGMAYSEEYLWIVGSHSTKRKRPKGKKQTKDIQRLSTVSAERNRHLLARVPIVNGAPVKSHLSECGKHSLTAAALQKSGDRNPLIEALEKDEHLGPFVSMGIPSKDNGLDIEGLAVQGNKVYLGLRGPVLRGWAVVLELELEALDEQTLSLKAIGEKGEVYRKHFVDLNGLGVRDLCLRGDDLIILAGPTMELAGAIQVFQLNNLLEHSKDTLWSQDETILSLLFDLPATHGVDKAEGITLLPCLGYDEALVVVHDAPSDERRPNQKSLFADVYRLPA